MIGTSDQNRHYVAYSISGGKCYKFDDEVTSVVESLPAMGRVYLALYEIKGILLFKSLFRRL